MGQCLPTIGLILSDGQTVQIAVGQLNSSSFVPKMDSLVEILSLVLQWVGVDAAEEEFRRVTVSAPPHCPPKGGQ